LKEEVGASGRVLGHSVLGDMGGPLRAGSVFEYATPEQVERYLKPLVAGDLACCFSMTEPDAGSDVRALRTTATRDGDGFRISGHKVFSSAGRYADFSVLIARMADSEPPVYSAFLVDLDSPGCRVVDGEVPMSGQDSESDIILDDCFVPGGNLLGAEGDGLRIGLGRVTVNRLLNCPSVLGQARRALTLSLEYARTRQASGGPLIALQAIQHKLADMATDYYAARSMTYDALADLDRGAKPRIEANMCKLFVSEAAFRIADQAVQIHGKAGVTRGSEVEWLFRRLRMGRIVTGSSEIQRNGIAKQLAAS
jgi:alkylation response protein AidB-like acyl-CoA dehydrogenase